MEAGLIGREPELAELGELAGRVRAGRGAVALVTGEAGAGKSRLAAHLAETVGLRALVARYRDGGSPPYAALADVLREALRIAPDCPPQAPALRAALAALLPELGDPEGDSDARTLGEAVTATLVALAGHGPLLVVLEDLQWADDAMLDLLPGLADRLRSAPVLLLATYRSDELPRGHALRRTRVELKRAGAVQEIEVSPLDLAETAALLESVLGAPVAPELAETIHRRTQGLPLFVEELAAALRAERLLEPGAGGLSLAAGRAIPLPESLRDAVVLRLDGLGAAAREAVELAAVAGTGLETRMLEALGAEADALGQLVARGLLVEAAAGRLEFRHDLTREAVREDIPRSRRRELHRRVAAWLETDQATPERVAEHWIEAGEPGRARRALVESARASCRVHAYRDAARSAKRALALWPAGEDEPLRVDALARLARCAEVSGQLGDAGRALRELLASPLLAGDPRARGEALRSLASVHGLQGNWQDAQTARAEAAAVFAAAGLDGEAAAEWLAAARHQAATLQVAAALETLEKALAQARRAGRRDVEARALGLQGNLEAMRGRVAEGREIATLGLSLALRHGQTDAAADIYRRLAAVHEYESDYRGASQAYAAALDFCRTRGAQVQAQVCLGCMTYVVFRTGEWRRAAELCREVIDDPRSPSGSRSAALAMIGLVHALRGEQRPARRRLGEALALSRRDENAAVELVALWGLGLADEQEGDDEAAANRYDATLDRWAATQDRHDVVPALMHIATWSAARGDEARLVRATEALSLIAAASGNPETLAGLAHALGEDALRAGDADAARRQFEQALVHLERLEVPLEKAFLTFRLGAAATAAGDREAGGAKLEEAYREARRLGARPLAARIDAELRRLGRAIRSGDGRRALAGTDRAGLTRRQADVARLVSSGLTNREIAARLHLSHRTVDMHVSHVLRRLDCRSRAEVVRKVTELGLLQRPPD